MAHYIEALELQREFIRIQAVLGGKNPHPQTYLVGGMATAMDGNEPDATINPERITLLNQLVANAQTFVRQVYLPDVLAIAGFYPEWFHYGAGPGNFMAYGDYTNGSIKDPAEFMIPRGILLGARSLDRASRRPQKRNGICHPFLVRIHRMATR